MKNEDISVEYDGERAFIPRIEIGPEARFEKDWMAAHRAWLMRVVIEPFAARSDAPPWKAEAIDFLRKTVLAWEPEDYTEFHPELAQLGAKLLSSGCDDPLIRFFAACWGFRNSRETLEIFQGLDPMAGYNATDAWGYVDAMENAVKQLDEAHYPRAPLRLFAVEIWRDWYRCYLLDKTGPWMDRVAEWTAGALAEGSYPPEEASIFVGQTMRWPLQPRNHIDMLTEAVSKSTLPDWAKKTLLGNFAMGTAWSSRGGGYANTVTAKGFLGFSEGMEKAEELFEDAWKLAPQEVGAPASQLEVLLTGQGRGKNDPFEWLQRALKAQPDFAPTASHWLFYHRPRWGGTVAEMLAFGRACLDTQRYDTELPELFVTAVYDAASETGRPWRKVTRIPWVGEGLVEATRGELNEPSRAGEKEKWQSLLATRAWAGGKFDVAKEAFAKIPEGRLHPAAHAEFRRMNTYEDRMRNELSVYGTPAWEEYWEGQAAVDEYRTSDHDAALKHYRTALAMVPPNSDAAKFLESEVALEEYETQFQTGEWTPIPLKLGAWRVRAGKFTNDGEEALVVHSNKSQRGFAWFQGITGQRYQLRGHFVSAPGKGKSIFGLAVRVSRSTAGEFLHFASSPADQGETYDSKLRDHFRDLEENGVKPTTGRSPAREDNEFLIEVTPESVSLELNGTLVIPAFHTKRYAKNFFDGRIGLVASHDDSAAETRITKLEIRKIGEGK